MTRSSRRKDKFAGRSKWTATKRKCEECGGDMVQLSANNYVCTKCGLDQQADY